MFAMLTMCLVLVIDVLPYTLQGLVRARASKSIVTAIIQLNLNEIDCWPCELSVHSLLHNICHHHKLIRCGEWHMADFGGMIDLYRSVTILAVLAVITLTKGPQDKYYFYHLLSGYIIFILTRVFPTQPTGGVGKIRFNWRQAYIQTLHFASHLHPWILLFGNFICYRVGSYLSNNIKIIKIKSLLQELHEV